MDNFDLSELSPNFLSAIFDISNTCNCRCRMCHFRLPKHRLQPINFMLPTTFNTILSFLSPYLKKLTLSAASEPLVSPYFLELLEILRNFKEVPFTNFLTNGILMDSRYADAIIDSNISEVCFSMHGATKQTYEHIVRGASFAKLLKNIEYLAEKKGKTGSGIPILHFNATIMRSNIAELEQIVELAANLGATSIAFRHLILYENLGMEHETLFNDQEISNYWIRKSLEKAAELNISVLNCPDFFSVKPESRKTKKTNIFNSFMHRCTKTLPFGCIDTPDNQTIIFNTQVTISGWALSKTGIDRVEIKREPISSDQPRHIDNDGLIFLGTAIFHNGTRPDVATKYPGLPMNNRSGWTFSFSDNILPVAFQPLFQISVIAYDTNGYKNILGIKMLKYDPTHLTQIPLLCKRPFDNIYIDSYGFVFPHPDCDTSKPFGSFLKESIENVWMNKSFTNLRRCIKSNNHPPMCENCADFINRQVDNKAYFLPKTI